MMDMLMENATEVRKEWSQVIDSVVREKPKFIKRTRDKMWLSNLDTMADILDAYKFTAVKIAEADGTVTLALNEIDLVENAPTEQEARKRLAESIMEYSMDFYNDYAYWSSAPNRKPHIPYIFKALILDDIKKLGESIICHGGKI